MKDGAGRKETRHHSTASRRCLSSMQVIIRLLHFSRRPSSFRLFSISFSLDLHPSLFHTVLLVKIEHISSHEQGITFLSHHDRSRFVRYQPVWSLLRNP
jgi:hypothetical protein